MKGVALTVFTAFLVCCTTTYFANCEVVNAVCDLFNYNSNALVGYVNFTQEVSSDEVKISGCVERLVAGKHGLHIHQFGILQPHCLRSGGHFNPEGKMHGGISDTERHVGDLGNIAIEKYSVERYCFPPIYDEVISLLPGKRNIIGRTLAITSDEDDLGKGSYADSKTIGHSGTRVACCVIGLASELPSYLVSHQPAIDPFITLIFFCFMYTRWTKDN